MIPEAVPLLAEFFADADYETAAFVTNVNVSEPFGFARGFEEFVHLPEKFGPDVEPQDHEVHQLSDRLHDVALRWIDHRERNRPFFLYLHSTDPHAPYTPREPFKSALAGSADPDLGRLPAVESLTRRRARLAPKDLEDLQALYDAEIRFNDETLGALLRELKRRTLFDSTILIILSDHGEEFYEHGGWQHATTVYEEQIAVPLVIRLPRGQLGGARISEPVSLVDIFPTLLDILGAEQPSRVTGRSLVPYFLGNGAAFEYHARPEVLSYVGHAQIEGLVRGDWKLVRASGPGGESNSWTLYNLVQDPREVVDLIDRRPIQMGYLQQRLEALRASWIRVEPETTVLNGELRKELRALGYLD